MKEYEDFKEKHKEVDNAKNALFCSRKQLADALVKKIRGKFPSRNVEVSYDSESIAWQHKHGIYSPHMPSSNTVQLFLNKGAKVQVYHFNKGWLLESVDEAVDKFISLCKEIKEVKEETKKRDIKIKIQKREEKKKKKSIAALQKENARLKKKLEKSGVSK